MSRNSSPLGRMLTAIDCPNSSLRFLILDCPTESTLDFYMEEFMRLNVVAVVRCCQPTYSANRLNERNIHVLDLPFKDGGVVSDMISIIHLYSSSSIASTSSRSRMVATCRKDKRNG